MPGHLVFVLKLSQSFTVVEISNKRTLLEINGTLIYRMNRLMMPVIFFGAKSSSTGNQLYGLSMAGLVSATKQLPFSLLFLHGVRDVDTTILHHLMNQYRQEKTKTRKHFSYTLFLSFRLLQVNSFLIHRVLGPGVFFAYRKLISTKKCN